MCCGGAEWGRGTGGAAAGRWALAPLQDRVRCVRVCCVLDLTCCVWSLVWEEQKPLTAVSSVSATLAVDNWSVDTCIDACFVLTCYGHRGVGC